MWSNGEILGKDGKLGFHEEQVEIGRDVFAPWKVLKALDQDDSCGNFLTVEIMRQVEGLSKYGRGFWFKIYHVESCKRVGGGGTTTCDF